MILGYVLLIFNYFQFLISDFLFGILNNWGAGFVVSLLLIYNPTLENLPLLIWSDQLRIQKSRKSEGESIIN